MNTIVSNQDEFPLESRLLVTGYRELPFRPDIPDSPIPTRAEREQHQFISMDQLCNITEKHGQKRSRACNAFGGDKGKIPVIPERQVWEGHGYSPHKYVQVSAVNAYLIEVGIDW